MSRYEFSYVPLGGATFPIIPVQLRTRESAWFATSALLDSGATISLFDEAVARVLGIPLRKGTRIQPTGIGGSMTAYVHPVQLKIGEEEFEGRVAFAYQRRLPVNLLGRVTVFERFVVTFDERNRRTILETA